MAMLYSHNQRVVVKTMVSCGFSQVLEALTGSLHWSSVWGSNDAGAVTNVMAFFLKMETSFDEPYFCSFSESMVHNLFCKNNFTPNDSSCRILEGFLEI